MGTTTTKATELTEGQRLTHTIAVFVGLTLAVVGLALCIAAMLTQNNHLLFAAVCVGVAIPISVFGIAYVRGVMLRIK